MSWFDGIWWKRFVIWWKILWLSKLTWICWWSFRHCPIGSSCWSTYNWGDTGEWLSWCSTVPQRSRQLGIPFRPRNIPPSPAGEWSMKWMPWKICCYNIPVDWWHVSAIPSMSSRLAVTIGVMSWRSWSRAASQEIAGEDWWSGPTVGIPRRPVCRSWRSCANSFRTMWSQRRQGTSCFYRISVAGCGFIMFHHVSSALFISTSVKILHH